MTTNDQREEPDDELPPEEEVDVSGDGDETAPLIHEFDVSSDLPPEIDASELVEPPAASALEPASEPPSAGTTSHGMTVGEALSVGMGQVPARLLPDKAGSSAMPPLPSVSVEAEPLLVSPPLSSPATRQIVTPGDDTPEKFYTYYEMRERYYNGESPPSTDPRSIFYEMPPSNRGKTRRLHVEVEVTVTNAERIAMISVEKAKHELKQLLSAHMLEISDKFYAVRQMIRQLSRG